MDKAKLLSILRTAEKPLSYDEIARIAKCNIAIIINEIDALKGSGYRIFTTAASVFLWENSDCAEVHELLSVMPEEYHNRILVREKLTSTNDIAKFLASAGAPEKSIVVAFTQSYGKGRNSRSFYSPALRGIYYTIILRPHSLISAFSATACAAVAVNSAIEKTCGERAGIKWLNDLLINDKKICGILAEACFEDEAYIAIGVGVNVSGEKNDFPVEIREKASSLEEELHIKVDRNLLTKAIAESMDEMTCLSDNLADYLEKYRADSVTIGRDVSIAYGSANVKYAHAEAINYDFSLKVTYSDGKSEDISSGEVSVRSLTAYI